ADCPCRLRFPDAKSTAEVRPCLPINNWRSACHFDVYELRTSWADFSCCNRLLVCDDGSRGRVYCPALRRRQQCGLGGCASIQLRRKGCDYEIREANLKIVSGPHDRGIPI